MNTEFLRLDDYNVPGYGLTVTGSMEIRMEDLSGETSGTDSVSKGIKPKTLGVSLNIRFQDAADLRQLIHVAEAQESGEGKVYTVTNREANAAGVRQVLFVDTVAWKPVDGVKAWNVTFSLRERLSVPERVEQRQKKPETVAQSSKGQAVQTKQERQEKKSPGLLETAGTIRDGITTVEKALVAVNGKLS